MTSNIFLYHILGIVMSFFCLVPIECLAIALFIFLNVMTYSCSMYPSCLHTVITCTKENFYHSFLTCNNIPFDPQRLSDAIYKLLLCSNLDSGCDFYAIWKSILLYFAAAIAILLSKIGSALLL